MDQNDQSPTGAKRVNVTMPRELHERSLDLVRSYYFGDFSSLIQHLLRRAIFDPSTLLSINSSPSVVSPEMKLKALQELQESVGLTPQKAAAWKAAVRDARR